VRRRNAITLLPMLLLPLAFSAVIVVLLAPAGCTSAASAEAAATVRQQCIAFHSN